MKGLLYAKSLCKNSYTHPQLEKLLQRNYLSSKKLMETKSR